MTKIAVPTRGQMVEVHFGHSNWYTIFTIDTNNNIVNSEMLPAMQDCACKSDMAVLLKQKGVDTLLAGNMGAGAFQAFQRHGIEVIRGCTGEVREVVVNYLAGKIQDSEAVCHHHEHHGQFHECKH